MNTAEEICESLLSLVLQRMRTIVLVRHKDKATEAANTFRTYLETQERGDLLKPPGHNPDFVKLSNGSWVFFIPCEELGPYEDVGQADFVLWPTLGGNYGQVRYRDWRVARASQDLPWRELAVSDVASSPNPTEESVWSRLVGEDDIG